MPAGVSSAAFCAAWCSLYFEAEKPRPEARPKRTPSQPTAVRSELKRKWPSSAAGILLEAPG